MANVIAAVGFPWVPVVAVSFSIASVPACCCCSYCCLRQGVPAVAKVSDVADTPTAVAVLFATGILNVSGVLDVAGFSAVVNMPSTGSCISAVVVP